jgi:hypothetical protein
MKRLAYFDCPYCKRSELYLSACKVWWERLLWVALLKAVRCHHCMRRSYTPFFIPGRTLKGPKAFPIATVSGRCKDSLPNRQVES